jgi:hypothetical protein
MTFSVVSMIVIAIIAGVLLAPFVVMRLRVASQRAFIRHVFKWDVSRDVVEELVRVPRKEPSAPVPRNVSFIVFQVRDDDIENVRGRLARALAIVEESGAMVEHIASSLVIATFGAYPRGVVATEDNRGLFASRLMSELGSDIRLVHGATAGLVGNFGSATRLSYGSALPNFGRILERLVQLDFGQSAEISATLT